MNVKTSPYCGEIFSIVAMKSCSNSSLAISNTYFRLAIGKELERIHSISHSATNDWKPVKHHRWLIWILEQDLWKDSCKDYKHEDGADGSKDCRIMLGEYAAKKIQDSRRHDVCNFWVSEKGDVVAVSESETRL